MSTSSSSAAAAGLGGGEGANRALLQPESSAYAEPVGMASEDVSSGGGGGLRSPPGLPHPVASAAVVVSAPSSSNEAQQYGTNAGTAGDSTTTTDQATVGVAIGGATSSQQSPSEAQLHLRSDPSPSPTLKATPMELPIELATRQSQPATQQTTTPGPMEVNTMYITTSVNVIQNCQTEMIHVRVQHMISN